MSKILLTGASGFVGQPLAKHLLESGYEVATISRNIKFSQTNLKTYQTNLEKREEVVAVFANFRPDYVIHNAALPNLSSCVLDLQSNVIPSVQLIDIASDFAVKKFIFASSGGAIYGEVFAPNNAKTSDTVSPTSAYGLGKLTIENYLAAHQKVKNLDYHIMRYSNIIGRIRIGEKLEFIVPKFIDKASNHQPLEVLGRDKFGDDGLLRDYIHVNDVIATNVLALQGVIQEKIINVCSGQEVSILQIAQAINQHFGYQSEIRFLEPRVGAVKRSVLDPAPLEQYFKPMNFEAALSDILHHI
jgi:UDP-glucose 4-epimerase